MEVDKIARALNGDGAVHLPKVWSVDRLPIDTENLPTVNDIQRWPYLRDIDLPVMEKEEDLLLIGTDIPEAFWVSEERRGHRKEPYAIRSPFGWTVMGPMGGGGGALGILNKQGQTSIMFG